MHVPKTFTFCTGVPATEEDEPTSAEDSGFCEPEDDGCEPEDAGCEPEEVPFEPEDSAPALDDGFGVPEEPPTVSEDSIVSPPVTGSGPEDDSSPHAIIMSDKAAPQASIFFMIDSFFYQNIRAETGNCKQICPYTRIISYSVQLITPFLHEIGMRSLFR